MNNQQNLDDYNNEQMIRIERIEETVTRAIQYIGLVSSVVMLAVYSQPRLRKLSVSIYFRCTAMFCIFSTVNNLIMFDHAEEIFQVSKISVEFMFFLSKFFFPFSAWLEVLASLDRFLTILFPFQFKFMQKTWFQLVLIVTLVVYNIPFYLYHIIGDTYLHVITGIPENWQGHRKIVYIIFISDLLNNSLIPFGIMLLTSMATFVGVLRAHRRIKSSSRRKDASHRKLIKDVKFGVTMIVLNVLFFICIGLDRLRFLVNINPFDRESQQMANFLFGFILTRLADEYFLLNFYIQLTVNSVVRNELVKIFKQIAMKLKKLFRIR